MIDGEIVVLDDEGHQPLRAAAGRAVARARGAELVFFAFDLRAARRLEPDRRCRSAKRKALLRAAAGRGDRALGDPVQRPRRRAAGRAFYEQVSRARARGRGLEARRRRPTSRAGRRPGSRPRRSSIGDFVIAGYTASAAAGGLGGAGARRVGGRRARLPRQGRHRLRRRRRSPTCSRGWRRCEDRALRARRRAEGHPLGAAGAVGARPLLQPAPPTARCATPSSRACARWR